MKISAIERLSLHFLPTDSSECWLWLGALDKSGYGVAYYEGRAQRAHRAVYSERVGPIPKGLELDHLCKVRRCVNPLHLLPVTHAENMSRGTSKAERPNCKQGHPFVGDNLIVRNGRRDCRECGRLAARRYYQRKQQDRMREII